MNALRELWQSQPLYYWATFAAIVLAVLVAFVFFRWSIRTNGKRELREIQRQFDRDMDDLDYRAWKGMRDIEEWAAKMEQAIREHPERVAALLSEDVPLHLVDEVAS